MVKMLLGSVHHDAGVERPLLPIIQQQGAFKYLERQGCLKPGLPLAARQFFISSTIASELSLPGSG
ncbi:hypothetical protein SAMN03159306_04792 [Pseudomonas sp. NFACC48-1]|nr:hypothetical protein SAMN03159424_02481 [Pseudomonas sp. NFACC05-1]SCZ44107.1 hypothetical protein SAMN03159405_05077 [Pseudomonas sp. NFACC44-2]SDA84112.1 hypothetical protein SAMN03159429_04652 [Pseudomonas sp. NFACC51]SDX71606.1 hypothetical protein SAMN03159474_03672 [Pseudomonas sp. NFACC08-1]SEJ44618.1 hypothetical protein SAMN03159298_03150 [Pseudomonas sp. NFACC07-1]SFI64589.1 hypothetical protein SAMN03159302_04524 [Pseudomonas sp. NFACC54]SFL37969.1 hypothetical protein SAMN03159